MIPMTIQFGNMLIIDYDIDINEIITRGIGKWTDNDMILYHIGLPIPIIKQGVGCVGIATPLEFTVGEYSTTVKFKFKKADKAFADAATVMYRSIMSNADKVSHDRNLDGDTIIPGYVAEASSSKRPKGRSTIGHFDFAQPIEDDDGYY